MTIQHHETAAAFRCPPQQPAAPHHRQRLQVVSEFPARRYFSSHRANCSAIAVALRRYINIHHLLLLYFSSTAFSSISDSHERFANRGRLGNTPRFINRGQNVSVRVHKRPQQQQQPTAAYESKELADAPNETEEQDAEVLRPRRINITHNGSANNKISSESTEDAENRYSDEIEPAPAGKNHIDADEKTADRHSAKERIETSSINPIDSTNYEDEREEKIQVVRKEPAGDDAGDEDDEDIDGVEDIEEVDDEPTTTLPAAGKNVTDNETTKLSDGTVILTSNFFLPGKKEGAEGASEEVEPDDEEIDGEDETIEQNTRPDVATTSAKKSTPVSAAPSSLPTTETMGSSSPTTKGSTTTTDGSLIEYEYEYEDYVDETTTVANEPAAPANYTLDAAGKPTDLSTTSRTATNGSTSSETNDPRRKEVVSVVTTKSVVNGSTSNPSSGEATKNYDKLNISSTEPSEVDDEAGANTTESWVVVASVQTSRSISGARFLPFPQVEQEEKKQILSDLDKEEENDDDFADDDDDTDEGLDEVALKEDAQLVTTPKPEDTTISSVENTTHVATLHLNQNQNGSVLKKIHEKLLHENVELTTKGQPVFIRKFSPKTTTARPPFGSTVHRADTQKKANLESVPQDDVSSLLPPGFKFRPTGSYKNRKITTTTEKPSEDEESSPPSQEVRARNETDSRSYKNKVNAQDVAGALPKDYKSNLTDKLKGADNNESHNESPKVSDLLSKIKFDDNIEMLLPKDYPKFTTKAPLSISTVTDNINKFLPPGFKLRKEEAKRPSSNSDDVSKFLPPGYKLPVPKDEDNTSPRTTAKPRLSTFTIADDISKFLPPDFKLPADESPPKLTIADDISKFLPPGFKLNADNDKTSTATPANNNETANNILNKLKFKTDISDLLPPGFKAPEETGPKSTAAPIDEGGASNFKVVFPKGINKRPGNRVTTPRPAHSEGPAPPVIQIRKGLPTR